MLCAARNGKRVEKKRKIRSEREKVNKYTGEWKKKKVNKETNWKTRRNTFEWIVFIILHDAHSIRSAIARTQHDCSHDRLTSLFGAFFYFNLFACVHLSHFLNSNAISLIGAAEFHFENVCVLYLSIRWWHSELLCSQRTTVTTSRYTPNPKHHQFWKIVGIHRNFMRCICMFTVQR